MVHPIANSIRYCGRCGLDSSWANWKLAMSASSPAPVTANSGASLLLATFLFVIQIGCGFGASERCVLHLVAISSSLSFDPRSW